MAKKQTKEQIRVWLAKNAPYLELIKYGGNSSSISTFYNNDTKCCFTYSLQDVKASIRKGKYVGDGLWNKVRVTLWLADNSPNITLEKYGGSTRSVSTFYNIDTGYMFDSKFCKIKERIQNGGKVGIAVTKNTKKSSAEESIKDFLKNNAPYIVLEKLGRRPSDKSVFRNTLIDKTFGSTILHLKEDIKNNREIGITSQVKFGVVPYTKSLEVKIENLLLANNITFIANKTLEGTTYRPDFLLPDYNLIIECDGLYWHSDVNIASTTYHQKKQIAYTKLGYRSFFFREDEINNKFDIITNIIFNALKMNTTRVFARKCTIVEIDPSFFTDNHLMGKGAGKCFGLSYDNEIMAGIQVKWNSVANAQLEISRFCTKNGVAVVGGFSKLVKHVEKILDPKEIKTFIDLRYGQGSYLESVGFEHKNTSLSFRWCSQYETFGRMKYPKNTGYDQGLFKIWDCGQAKYVKKV